jgi:hypothetical protein
VRDQPVEARLARADDQGADGGALEEPVESELRDGLAGFGGEGVEGVDYLVDVLPVGDGAGVGGQLALQAGGFGERLAAADLAGEAAPAERAPDEGSDALIGGEGHELPLVVAADEGVVDLVTDVAGPAVTLGDGEGFHEVPAGEVGAGDVADFSCGDEFVQRAEGFFDGGGGVEGVQVVDVDVVGVEALEGVFEGLDEMVAGAADVVGAKIATAEGGLGGDEDVLSWQVRDGFAEDDFAVAVGVDVGGVEEVTAGFHADVDEVFGFGVLGAAPGFEEFVGATEGAGAEAELGDFDAGAAERAVVHECLQLGLKEKERRRRASIAPVNWTLPKGRKAQE